MDGKIAIENANKEDLEAYWKIGEAIDKVMHERLSDETSTFHTMNPGHVVASIITTVMLYLFIKTAHAPTFQGRVSMAEDLIEKVGAMFLDALEKYELIKTETGTPN